MTFTSNELHDLVALARHHREHWVKMEWIKPDEDLVVGKVTTHPNGIVEIAENE